MRATIRNIAEVTGLSITTVSLILNNKGDRFPEKTKKLVFDTATTLNYRPNQLAIGLLTKQTCTIGLIIPDISNLFFAELTKGIEDRGREDGFNVILCNSNDKYALERLYINILADRRVDGIIMVMSAESYGPRNAECLAMLHSLGIPVILADCFDETSDFSTVSIDNMSASSMAVHYLLELGHKRIGCITGPLGLKTNKERLAGYTKALVETGIESTSKMIYEGNFRYQSGYEGALVLMNQKPTAIFCQNDLMAFGAMRALKEKGISIPDDVSIMGFDNIFFSSYMDIPLSTIDQPIYEMGRKSAELLLEEIADKNIRSRSSLFATRLIIRDSTATPNILSS